MSKFVSPLEVVRVPKRLTLPMLRPLSSKHKDTKIIENQLNLVMLALIEYSQMCTHVPRFQSFFSLIIASFYSGHISHDSSIRVKQSFGSNGLVT